MRTFLTCSAAIAALLAGSAAGAGTLISVPAVPNSTTTTIFGINDSSTIAGSYISSTDSLEHGFVGPLDGSNYTTIDAPAGSTEPRAMSNDGTITGFSNNDGTPEDYIPFERTPDGTITNVTKNGKTLNYDAQGLSNHNDKFGGSYFSKTLVVKAYLGKNAAYMRNVAISITNLGVAARGVNHEGDIVGWYYDKNGVQNGLLISGGTATKVDYPDSSAASSVLEGINDNGKIAGQWTDTGGVIHAFVYDMTTGKFRSIDVPGSTSYTQAWGSNDHNWTAVSSDVGSYVYCPGSNCPSGIRIVEKETYKPLKDMPHAACVNGCLAPMNEQDMPAAPKAGSRTQRRAHSGPMEP